MELVRLQPHNGGMKECVWGREKNRAKREAAEREVRAVDVDQVKVVETKERGREERTERSRGVGESHRY